MDIPIEFIGLRPGEKLFEEICLDDEAVDATSHQKIFVVKNSNSNDIEGYRRELGALRKTLLRASDAEVVRVLQQIVPNYRPAANCGGEEVPGQYQTD